MKKLILLLALLLIPTALQAQTTTVTGTFTDASSQALAYGSVRIDFVPISGSNVYICGGVSFNPNTYYIDNLDNTGSFSQVLTLNTACAPAGSQWRFTACPSADTPCSSAITSINTSPTQDVSSLITIPTIQVPAQNYKQPKAYADSEIVGPVPGFTYWNLSLNTLRVCQGPLPCTWVSVGGGGGSVTSFSAGNLSPLFTTSVATATTTPVLSFALSNAPAFTYFGNSTGSSAPPSFLTNMVLQPTTGVAMSLTGAPDLNDALDINIGENAGHFVPTAGIDIRAVGDGNTSSGILIFHTITENSGEGRAGAYNVYEIDIRGSNIGTGGPSVGESFTMDDVGASGGSLNLQARNTQVNCLSTDAICDAFVFDAIGAIKNNAVHIISGDLQDDVGNAYFGTNAALPGILHVANPNVGGAYADIENPSTTTEYIFNLPATPGSVGQFLTSQGGGSNSMTWTNPPTGFNPAIPGPIGGTTPNTIAATSVSATSYVINGKCISTANPAVCGSSSGGFFVIAVSAGTVVIDTTAVLSNSIIGVAEDDSIGPLLGVSCNSAGLTGNAAVVQRPPASTGSFTFGVANAPSTYPFCFSWLIQ